MGYHEEYIVCIDDAEGSFELVYWAESIDDAESFYDELTGLPDGKGRNRYIFKKIQSSEQVRK